MARVCISTRQFSSQAVSTALLLATVVAEPVSTDVQAVDVASDTSAANGEQIGEVDSDEKLDSPAAPSVDIKGALGKVVCLASRMVVLSDFAAQTTNEALKFEVNVLTPAVENSIKDDAAVESINPLFKEWSALQFSYEPAETIEDVETFFQQEILRGANNVKTTDQQRKLRNELILTLALLEGYEGVINELHKADDCFKDITPQAVEQSKNSSQNILQWLMRAQQQGDKHSAIDLDGLMTEDPDDDAEFNESDFIDIPGDSAAEPVAA